MIDCPKCGFSQPKDQFCANCGIDVERYSASHRPKITPSIRAGLTAGLVALVLVVSLVALKPFLQISADSPQDIALEEERIESFGRFNLGERRGISSAPEEVAAREASPLRAAPAEQAEDESSVAGPQEPKFSFVLVRAPVLARWIRDAADFTAQGGISSGLLGASELGELTKINPQDKILTLNGKELIEEGYSFLSPLSELGLESAGLSLDANLDDNILELSALSVVPEQRIQNGVSSWHETEIVQRWAFDLRSAGALFVVGLLPRPPQVPRTSPWNLQGLFELWDLEDFVEGDKDLVLIIESGR